jgi:hypothetical protein
MNRIGCIRSCPTGRGFVSKRIPRVASAVADFTLGYFRVLPPAGGRGWELVSRSKSSSFGIRRYSYDCPATVAFLVHPRRTFKVQLLAIDA